MTPASPTTATNSCRRRSLDARGLETTAIYNYRVIQPAHMTDPNATRTCILYSPIGLPAAQFVRGTDALGNETLGGTEGKPEISFEYDLLNFEKSRRPIFVQTTRRTHHDSVSISDEVIETREYSDGFGRLVQTRSQAEEFIFGNTGDEVGLPLEAGAPPGPLWPEECRDSAIVSGWQVIR